MMVNRVASGTQHRGDSFEAIRRLSSHTTRFFTTFAASSAGLISFAQPMAPPPPPPCMFSPSNLIAPMFVQATASSSSSSSLTLRAATLSGIQGARHPLSSCTSLLPCPGSNVVSALDWRACAVLTFSALLSRTSLGRTCASVHQSTTVSTMMCMREAKQSAPMTMMRSRSRLTR